MAKNILLYPFGFCGKGSLKDRIAIPLEDPKGNLIGYAGRVVDDEAVSAENPKYLFPSERERRGKILTFQKSVFLYNGWRIEKPVRDLVVVEGFAATWWLWQNGVSDVVALMGASCSAEQGKLIVKLLEPDGCLWIFTDGDEAGRKCGASVFLHVAPHRYTRSVVCDEGKQPTDWTPEELMGSFPSLNGESGHSDEPIGETDQGTTDETQDLAAAS